LIIVLNGYPGVGKLTIGRELASRLNARLLDAHSVYNVAFALTEFKSPEFRATVDKVEAIAHDLILKLSQDQPVVLTAVLSGGGDWAQAQWMRIEQLGKARPPLCVVHIECQLDENIRRICSEDRDQKRKPRDPEYARKNQANAKPLLGGNSEHFLALNTTQMTASAAAATIAEWALGH
jgi:shikimate kinase